MFLQINQQIKLKIKLKTTFKIKLLKPFKIIFFIFDFKNN
jgi:hypothetical protein